MWNRRNPASKFGATRVSHAGYSFASRLEAAVFDLLKLKELAGQIAIERVQDSVKLSLAEILYKPDFRCVELPSGNKFWVEAKGHETPEWRIKRRLWMHYGPGPLLLYMGSYRQPCLVETIVPHAMDTGK